MRPRTAALVPAPRVHLVRFHGILGPAAAWRSLIIPTANDNTESAPAQGNSITSSDSVDTAVAEGPQQKSAEQRRRNYSWADLMKRVFDHATNYIVRSRSVWSCPDYPSLSSTLR